VVARQGSLVRLLLLLLVVLLLLLDLVLLAVHFC
jgi:hypothetical protein